MCVYIKDNLKLAIIISSTNNVFPSFRAEEHFLVAEQYRLTKPQERAKMTQVWALVASKVKSELLVGVSKSAWESFSHMLPLCPGFYFNCCPTCL
jgi:hypothetical protein